MERNLYARVVRITATMPSPAREAAQAGYLNESDRTLGPIAYLRFAAAHPVPVTNHLLRDAGAFFAKSGVERITLDYLGTAPNAAVVQDPKEGWRRQLELHGPVHTASYL
jgi:hypothetical protein